MAGISLYSFIIQALGGIVVKTVHSLEDAIQDFGVSKELCLYYLEVEI